MFGQVWNFILSSIGNAFDVLFEQFEISWGNGLGTFNLGHFIVVISLLHFLIDKLLPFLSGGEADKAKPTHEETFNPYSGSNSKYMY